MIVSAQRPRVFMRPRGVDRPASSRTDPDSDESHQAARPAVHG